jgi:hypothetical protein
MFNGSAFSGMAGLVPATSLIDYCVEIFPVVGVHCQDEAAPSRLAFHIPPPRNGAADSAMVLAPDEPDVPRCGGRAHHAGIKEYRSACWRHCRSSHHAAGTSPAMTRMFVPVKERLKVTPPAACTALPGDPGEWVVEARVRSYLLRPEGAWPSRQPPVPCPLA